MGSKQRLSFLDGIRGWAAFSVLLWHTFSETFGHLYPVFKSPYLIFVMQGHLDVMVFFVLSGQALSISFIRKKDPLALLSLAIKRYPRLAIPSFFSCLLSLAVIGLGFNFAGAAGAIVHSDWLARFYNSNRIFGDFCGKFFIRRSSRRIAPSIIYSYGPCTMNWWVRLRCFLRCACI